MKKLSYLSIKMTLIYLEGWLLGENVLLPLFWEFHSCTTAAVLPRQAKGTLKQMLTKLLLQLTALPSSFVYSLLSGTPLTVELAHLLRPEISHDSPFPDLQIQESEDNQWIIEGLLVRNSRVPGPSPPPSAGAPPTWSPRATSPPPSPQSSVPSPPLCASPLTWE